jgi:hydrogenase nickel incorporation protein HypB
MCSRCGCGTDEEPVMLDLRTGEHVHADGTRHSHRHDDHHHDHDHDSDPVHDHGHRHAPAGMGLTEIVQLETRLLAKNDALAARNRAWFAESGVLALNLVSGPGAGKTTLLERTIADLSHEIPLFVIEGDQATALDGERIRKAGAPAVQVNTGVGCHLEADMVWRGVEALRPSRGSIMMIENVGNLVCPALFDLGERAKVAVLAVTDGEDKPLKYPHMFRAADLVVINKVDLVPYLDIDLDGMVANAHRINPGATVLTISARSGEGLASWYDWLRAQAQRPGLTSGTP